MNYSIKCLIDTNIISVDQLIINKSIIIYLLINQSLLEELML